MCIYLINFYSRRAHPWFQHDLPPYLLVSSETNQKSHTLDEETIEKVVEMGYDRDKIHNALSLGPDLLTKPKMLTSTTPTTTATTTAATTVTADRFRNPSIFGGGKSNNAHINTAFDTSQLRCRRRRLAT